MSVKAAVTLNSSSADVDKAIKSIAQRGKIMDADIHAAACASLNHVGLHGDTTLLNRLVLAMPKSARRNALVVWCLKFGKVLQNTSKTKDHMPLVFDRDGVQDVDGAVAQPFYDLKNVKEGGKEWVYSDYIKTVTKRLAAAVAADPTSDDAKRAQAALDALAGVV